MASPAPKPPSGTPNNEALDILRRLEPALSVLDERTQRIEVELKDVKAEQRRTGERLANLEGRVSQLPTMYQIAALVFAIFGAAFVLIRFASGH
jgi:hypothetical protein